MGIRRRHRGQPVRRAPRPAGGSRALGRQPDHSTDAVRARPDHSLARSAPAKSRRRGLAYQAGTDAPARARRRAGMAGAPHRTRRSRRPRGRHADHGDGHRTGRPLRARHPSGRPHHGLVNADGIVYSAILVMAAEGTCIMKIGFIGSGIMGRPMAENLLRAGHKLYVYGRRFDSIAPMLVAGALGKGTPAEVAAEADISFTVVSDTTAVEQLILGDRGLVHGAKPGHTIVDMSTVSP